MKHLKLFENKSAQSIKNLIEEFNNFLRDIKPVIIKEYLRLAKDKRYEPEQGDKPIKGNVKNLALIEVITIDDYFEFLLQDYDNNGFVTSQYFISISNEDMEEALIDLDAKKYNL